MRIGKIRLQPLYVVPLVLVLFLTMLGASGIVQPVRAFAAQTGEELWKHDLPFIGSSSPMMFMHEGVQYVVIPATGGGTLALYDPEIETGNAFVAFRLRR